MCVTSPLSPYTWVCILSVEPPVIFPLFHSHTHTHTQSLSFICHCICFEVTGANIVNSKSLVCENWDIMFPNQKFSKTKVSTVKRREKMNGAFTHPFVYPTSHIHVHDSQLGFGGPKGKIHCYHPDLLLQQTYTPNNMNFLNTSR